MKKYEDVVRTASLAIKTGSDDPDFFNLYLGIAAYNLNEYGRAVSFLKKAINKNPNNGDAYRYLGLSIKQLGNEKLGGNLITRAKQLTHAHGSFIENENNFHLQHY